MKIKSGYVLQKFADKWLAVADDDIAQNTLITLNGTGAFVWERLQSDTDEATLVAAVCDRYAVDEAAARTDLTLFLETMRGAGLLDE